MAINDDASQFSHGRFPLKPYQYKKSVTPLTATSVVCAESITAISSS